MKFSCDSKPLAYALNKCVALTARNSTYPFSRNFLIETIDSGTIKITATDMSTMLTYYVTDTVHVEDQGVACVDAHSLTTFVSAKAGTVNSYVTPAGRLMTKIAGNKVSLSQIPDEQFPRQPGLPDNMIAKVSGKGLAGLLSISFMADQKDVFSSLGGTLLVAGNEHLFSMAASQGRLGYAWIATSYKGTGKFLLPSSTTGLLPRLLYDDDQVLIYIKGPKMFFVTDRFTLICNQVQGNFPYERVTAMANAPVENEVIVSADELHNAISTCLAMSKDVQNKLWKKISFQADTEYSILDISTAKENEIGHMNWVVPIRKHTDTSFNFDLYSGFAWDVLKATGRARETDLIAELMTSPRISIGYAMSNENKLIRIVEQGMNAIFIIAPLGQIEIVDAE